MTLAQEIYQSLLKDPDLDVGPNQTREEFAKQEAEQRARQHHNNAVALSLANSPTKENSINKLVSFVDKPPVQKHYTDKTPEFSKPVSEENATKTEALMAKHPDVVEHMYREKYGDDNPVTSLDDYKATLATRFSKGGVESTTDIIATAAKEMKVDAAKKKEAETKAAAKTKEKADKKEAAKAKAAAKTKEEADKAAADEEADDAKKEAKIADALEAAEAQDEATKKQEVEEKKAAEEAKKKAEEKAEEKAEKTAEKTAAKKTKEDRAKGAILPVKAGELEKRFGKDEDGNPNAIPEHIVTAHAIALAAHHKRYKDSMSPKTLAAVVETLNELEMQGADISAIEAEIEAKADSFGSDEHLEATSGEARKTETRHKNHKNLLDGKTVASQEALKDAYKNLTSDEESTTGRARHILSDLTPMQKKIADDVRAAQRRGDTELFNEKAKELKDTGISEEDIEHMVGDDTNKYSAGGDGPPDEEVARRKEAEGYVFNEATRHWILKETLEEMEGSHGGFDASIINAKHDNDGKSAVFAYDIDGNVSEAQFLFHPSTGLMPMGDGTPPKGDSMSDRDLVSAKNHSDAKRDGHLQAHDESGKTITRLENYTSDEGTSKNPGLVALNKPDAKKSGGVRAKLSDAKAKVEQGYTEGPPTNLIPTAAKTIARFLDPTGISQARFAANVIGLGGAKGLGFLNDYVNRKLAPRLGSAEELGDRELEAKRAGFVEEAKKKAKKEAEKAEKKAYLASPEGIAAVTKSKLARDFQKQYGMPALNLFLEEFPPAEQLKNTKQTQELLNYLGEQTKEIEKPVGKSIITI